MSEQSFEQMLNESFKTIHTGEVVSGTVLDVKEDQIILNIGYKSDGVITRNEYTNNNSLDLRTVVQIGDELEAKVMKVNDGDGQVSLSYRRLAADRGNKRLEEAFNNHEVLKAKVVQVLNGGLSVLVDEARVFIPASLVSDSYERDLNKYADQEIEFVITEFNPRRRRIIGDRKQLMQAAKAEMQKELFSRIKVGDVVEGTVKNVTNFGAFVDLGGVDGLVHVSELSWKHIDHPNEVVEVGTPVTVEVLEVDMDRERVSLSLKATQEDPWQTFARLHQIGQIVPGKVTKLVPFGAFVRVGDGIEGLVHVSELAERHVEIPEQVVSVGDEVMVKVIDIDLERRRVSLSLKQANEGVDVAADEFDASLYGMADSYDEQGNYIYPEGFDPETNEWKSGYEEQQAAWEQQYAEAQARWEAHKRQVAEAAEAERQAATAAGTGYASTSTEPAEGSLASDEALQALREKLTGSN